MVPFTCTGRYEDVHGVEAMVWRFTSRNDNTTPYERFEIRCVIRGVELAGHDFDGLEPTNLDAASAALPVPLGSADELVGCVLAGELPCVVDHGGDRHTGQVRFTVDLRLDDEGRRTAPLLTLSIQIADMVYEVDAGGEFDDGLQRLARAMPANIRLVCCHTCLFSDYSPAGHEMTGIRCHRGAKAQYLRVRGKVDYWRVPVTEEVPETYLCGEYESRIAGTGYRG